MEKYKKIQISFSNSDKMDRKILGLDLGSNSIGWAVVNQHCDDDGNRNLTGIDCAGSRIIPMEADTLSKFESGTTESQTAERTRLRGGRRLYERSHLRRARLHRVLMEMDWLPTHYAKCLDRYGNIIRNTEPKLAWQKGADGKSRFLFADSFAEMLSVFRERHPEMDGSVMKIPYDWTLYYLRTKALTQAVSKHELAWILLSFNQKRGYHMTREDISGSMDVKDDGKKQEYLKAKVIDVKPTDGHNGKGVKYEILLDGGHVYYLDKAKSKPDWIGKTKEFILTIDKNGKESLRMPKEEDWTLQKKRTESEIKDSHMTPGQFIFNGLLNDPSQKIRGKLISTIDRSYYKDELKLILNKQREFHSELNDKELYERCIICLYPSNEAHRASLKNKGFPELFIDDILFWQRPLKSKKSLISDCQYEERVYVDSETGERHVSKVKCIAKSHPLFEEFRLWQFISNLRIFEKERVFFEKTTYDEDVTGELLPDLKSRADLYDRLSKKSRIDMKDLLILILNNKKDAERYRWNYPEDAKYDCCITRCRITDYLKKADADDGFLNDEALEHLWHILYSISEVVELKKALNKYAEKYGLNAERFVEIFSKFKPFEKDYGAYSFKAIKKLLPLMRLERYWDIKAIDPQTRNRIEKILSGEYDENISENIREKFKRYKDISDFQGLDTWQACYLVYGRHSEAKNADRWTKPEDIDSYLASFKQHSLHNPIVEKVVLETLRTVRDIWRQVGHIDEIHVELGREVKNPADVRKKLAERMRQNEDANLRIKAMLEEFLNPEFKIEGVRPNSPSQQEALRIYEETVLSAFEGTAINEKESNELKEMQAIVKKFSEPDIKKRPTRSEVLKYKLWLDQKYISPYTGRPIPLGKLFTSEYEIEHIIPRARYFDDSLSNKVICEAAVNKEKGSMLGYEFICSKGGSIVRSGTEDIKILDKECYEKHVRDNYKYNRTKQKKLMMSEIPDDFIERQLNDSRYISRLIKSILSNIVREDGEQEATSKNIISCTGQITDRLKKDWGVNSVWNGLILPRFKRMETLPGLNGKKFTALNQSGKLIPSMPLEYQKGFSAKRIDHRHHAMDAIVIACADRNIVNLLNNEAAREGGKIRYDLQRIVCEKTPDAFGGTSWKVKIPWGSFVIDTRKALEDIIVSFKQNKRVLTKTSNSIVKYENGRKIISRQLKGDRFSIRKSLHKATVLGEINLRDKKEVAFAKTLKTPEMIVDKALKTEIRRLISDGKDAKEIVGHFKKNGMLFRGKNISKVEIYYFTKDAEAQQQEGKSKTSIFASRTSLFEYFKNVPAEKIEDRINKITDSGIRKILLAHLKACGNDPELAFSADGIERMNANIATLNGGRRHEPILKVRTFEKGTKFPVGEYGNKGSKFVEADKGTNLYFAVYDSENGRSFTTVPLIDVIMSLKEGIGPVPEINKNGERLLFYLSPNDLVYLPTRDEIESGHVSMPLDRSRIYRMVSCTEKRAFFISFNIAKPIIDKVEFSSLNKTERAITGEMIKETCIPLKIDRLGNLVGFNPNIL